MVKIVRRTREMIESEGFGPSFHTRCFPKDPAELALRPPPQSARRRSKSPSPATITAGAGGPTAPPSSVGGGGYGPGGGGGGGKPTPEGRRPSKEATAVPASNGGRHGSQDYISPTCSTLKSPPQRSQRPAEVLVDESPWHPLITTSGFDFQMQTLPLTNPASIAMPAIVVDCADGKRTLTPTLETSVIVQETIVRKEVRRAVLLHTSIK